MPAPQLSQILYRYGGQSYRFAEDVTRLHVSDLYQMCFRQVFFIAKEGVAYNRSIAPKLQMKFEMGRAIEKVIKGWLKDKGLTETEELELIDHDLGIVGHADARLTNGMLLEIKAKDPAVFRLTRRAPLRRDQFQLEVYLWIDQTKMGDLLCVTWGDEKNPYRDTIVKYNLKVGELVKRRVSEFRDAQAGGKIPDRICKNASDPLATLCPVKAQCFAHEGNITKTIADSL